MKRILIITAMSMVVILVMVLSGIKLWIRESVKEHIQTATYKYGGSAEEALIAFLLDEENSFEDRTHVAVWTLGQIRSDKALPILQDLYRDDPRGKSCHGHHDHMLCQYEIHKAIQAIERGSPFNSPGLK
jgi:hypothetical protein